MWRDLYHAFLGFLFPPHCLLCKTALPEKPGLCPTCARLSGCATGAGGYFSTVRGVEVFVLNVFNEQIRQLIHMLKYQGKTLPGKLLGRYLGQKLAQEIMFDRTWVVVPVALHAARKRARGYNQSAVIARAFAEETGLLMHEKILKRVRFTPSQTQLDRDARFRNVAAAFQVCPNHTLMGRSVVLIDDVLTTGATALACVEVLMCAGVRRVVIAAAAQPKWGEDNREDGV